MYDIVFVFDIGKRGVVSVPCVCMFGLFVVVVVFFCFVLLEFV